MKISVIVPVYKVEPYLRRCVDSVLAQTYKDFELILVDDGSPDRCGEICDEYAKKDCRVVVIHQKNAGLSAARNAGIDWAFAHSNSEWLTFVDSDDWVSEAFLEGLVEGVDAGAEISCCSVSDVSQGVEADEEPFGDRVDVLSPRVYWRTASHSVNSWGKLIPKKLFVSMRFPIGKIHEDTYLTHRIVFAVDRISVCTKGRYYYFIRKDGITGAGRSHCWTRRSVDAIAALKDQMQFFAERGFPELVESTRWNLCWCYSALIAEFGMREYRQVLRVELAIGKLPILKNGDFYWAAFPLRMIFIWPVLRIWDLLRRRGVVGICVHFWNCRIKRLRV